MKILLLGARGQLGWQLQRSLAVLGDVTALHRGSAPLCGDLSKPDALAQTVRTLAPDAVVNAAAYTAVDKAETDRDLAWAINGTACDVLARECATLGAWLVHYSTDYVFNGTGDRAWTEADPTTPLNAYGASKLAGEQAITAQHAKHLIFRASWVFDTWGGNFLKSILRAAQQRDSLNVVNDQFGAPTRAALMADVTAHVLARLRGGGQDRLAGIYHLAAAGVTQWHEYASFAIAEARAAGMPVQARAIHPIAATQYPTPAARPANSRLDTTRLRETFGLVLPPWQDGVRAVVAELAVKPFP